MSEPSMPKVGDLVADKYEVSQLIGEGGMGSVFLASHRMTGKKVALKWMLPELARDEDAVQRFLREAQAAGRIAHPNVVDIYDVGEHAGSYFLVMEYLNGEPLSDAMENGALEPAQIIDIILPCLKGVGAAHRKGVIHRDLKPDNIFLCRNDEGSYMQPKVLDFGISKLSGGDGDLNPRLTRTGAVMGTPYYMSPEQIRGSHDVDGRCDVYAFAVILYEAMTGQVPFSAETYSALVLEIATGVAKPPHEVNPGIPVPLAEVLMKAMAREPADRYPDVTAFGEALERFAGSVRFTMDRMDPTGRQAHAATLAGGSTTSTPFATDQTILEVPGRRRGMGKWVAMGAVAALGLAGVVTLSGPGSENSPVSTAVDADVGGAENLAPKTKRITGQAGRPLLVVPEDSAASGQSAEAAGEATGQPTAQFPEDDSAADLSPAAPENESVKAKSDQTPVAEQAAQEVERLAKAVARRKARKARLRERARAAAAATETSSTGTSKPVATPPKPIRKPGRTGTLSVDDF